MRFYRANTCERIEFDDKETAKALKEGYVPSVSTILGIIHKEFLEKWIIKNCLNHYKISGNLEKAKAFRDNSSAEFGTCCHSILEGYSQGNGFEVLSETRLKETESGDLEEVNIIVGVKGANWTVECTQDHITAVTPALDWVDKNVDEFIFVEKQFADGELGYGGTADMLLILKTGEFLLGDLKCKKNSWKFPIHPSVEYKYQLSAYRNHFKKEYGDMMIGNLLIASPFGANQSPYYPFIKPEIYGHKDWTEGFNAAYRLWIEQYIN